MRLNGPDFPLGDEAGAFVDYFSGDFFVLGGVGREGREEVNKVEGILEILQRESEGRISVCELIAYQRVTCESFD